MPTVTGTILEVGPTSVRTLRPPRSHRQPGATSTSVRPEVVTAALGGIDDTTVLLDERPVAVAALWRAIITDLVPPRHSLTVVHPSWWPQRRVRRIVEAAVPVVATVVAVPRAALFTAGEATAVVEITGELVAIAGRQGTPTVLRRPVDPTDVARTAHTDGAQILIDGTADAGDFARAVRDALHRRGVRAELALIDDVAQPAPTDEPAVVARAPRRAWVAAAAAVSVAASACALAYAAAPAGPHVAVPAADTVNLVEGRITLRIPSSWEVARITAGPGSRRVQVSSPADRAAALHVTQSYAPGETLATTAETLRQAVTEQPDGVFVDFNAADRRGERPAVTYRETRPGREIWWAVVLDGATRISIGCQSAAGRQNSVARVCEQAIGSARELTGTESAP